jgi:hypothetical protein
MPPKKPCKVCAGMEVGTVDRLLLIGRGPRLIAPVFGHTRRAVRDHRDRCLTGARRERVVADLLRMASEAEAANGGEGGEGGRC